MSLTGIKKVWMERALDGFLRDPMRPMCPKTRLAHRLADNKNDRGMMRYCRDCHAGLAPQRSRKEINEDLTKWDEPLRVGCWMCGSAFSRPRTRDEYEEQLCAWCLVACEKEGVLTIRDALTRDHGGLPPFQTVTR